MRVYKNPKVYLLLTHLNFYYSLDERLTQGLLSRLWSQRMLSLGSTLRFIQGKQNSTYRISQMFTFVLSNFQYEQIKTDDNKRAGVAVPRLSMGLSTSTLQVNVLGFKQKQRGIWTAQLQGPKNAVVSLSQYTVITLVTQNKIKLFG